jgi:hypothetical protein
MAAGNFFAGLSEFCSRLKGIFPSGQEYTPGWIPERMPFLRAKKYCPARRHSVYLTEQDLERMD